MGGGAVLFQISSEAGSFLLSPPTLIDAYTNTLNVI